MKPSSLLAWVAAFWPQNWAVHTRVVYLVRMCIISGMTDSSYRWYVSPIIGSDNGLALVHMMNKYSTIARLIKTREAFDYIIFNQIFNWQLHWQLFTIFCGCFVMKLQQRIMRMKKTHWNSTHFTIVMKNQPMWLEMLSINAVPYNEHRPSSANVGHACNYIPATLLVTGQLASIRVVRVIFKIFR